MNANNFNHSRYTKEEDTILIESNKQFGNQWHKYALLELPHRTDSALTQRMTKLRKKGLVVDTTPLSKPKDNKPLPSIEEEVNKGTNPKETTWRIYFEDDSRISIVCNNVLDAIDIISGKHANNIKTITKV